MPIDNELKNFLTNLFLQYNEELIKIAWRRLGNEEDAKDVVSFVYYTATLKCEVLYHHPNKIGWLQRTLDLAIRKHKVINTYRKTELNEDGEKIKRYEYFETISIDNKLENFLDYQETYPENWLEDYTDILTTEELKYIMYKFEYMFTAEELAKEFGKSYSATTTFGSRIMNKLKKILKKRDKNDKSVEV